MSATVDSNPQLTVSEKSAYWMVWSPHGKKPRRRQPSRDIAVTEATRLATLHPGRHFYVLECVGFVMVGHERTNTSESGAVARDDSHDLGESSKDSPVSETVTATGITEVIAQRGRARLVRRT